ncbi:MAG TPA: GNAT family protein [Vicinamibacteria bacterium]
MIPGQRVRLRRIERADLPRFVEWLNDPELRDHLAAIYPLSQAQEEQWFESMLRQEPTQQPFAIDARLKPKTEAWTLVGTISFHSVDWRHRTAELGLFIGPRELWGKGFGTDAMRALVAFAFQELNLHRVWLRVYEENTRARRSYEKVGFVVEGRLRQDRFHGGRYTDTLVMGLLREEWHEGEDARGGSSRSGTRASTET